MYIQMQTHIQSLLNVYVHTNINECTCMHIQKHIITYMHICMHTHILFIYPSPTALLSEIFSKTERSLKRNIVN